MTMVVATHEMASGLVFMDDGPIMEEGVPEHFFSNPRHGRTRMFLSKLLSH